MEIQTGYRDLSADTDAIAVSESAKRQIAAKVLVANLALSGSGIGPSFMDGFPDFLEVPGLS